MATVGTPSARHCADTWRWRWGERGLCGCARGRRRRVASSCFGAERFAVLGKLCPDPAIGLLETETETRKPGSHRNIYITLTHHSAVDL